MEHYVVDPATLLRRNGIAETPENLAQAQAAVLDAQVDVQGFLRRSLVPTQYVAPGCYPYPEGWRFDPEDDPVIEIVSADAEFYSGAPTGRFAVTYLAGLDVATDPALAPIRLFVSLHAENSPRFVRLWQTVTGAKGAVKSSSTEGQSVSYAEATLGGGGAAGTAAPGAMPDKGSVVRWQRPDVDAFQRRGSAAAWPYGGAPWPS